MVATASLLGVVGTFGEGSDFTTGMAVAAAACKNEWVVVEVRQWRGVRGNPWDTFSAMGVIVAGLAGNVEGPPTSNNGPLAGAGLFSSFATCSFRAAH